MAIRDEDASEADATADDSDDGVALLSDAERAERVAEIGVPVHGSSVRSRLMYSLPVRSVYGDVGKARRLYGDAERLVGNGYPDLVAFGTSIWLADKEHRKDETYDDAPDA